MQGFPRSHAMRAKPFIYSFEYTIRTVVPSPVTRAGFVAIGLKHERTGCL